METLVTELKQRLMEVDDLRAAAALLNWDQSTYMPPGGAPARGRQMATLYRLAHERFTDPAVGRILDALEPQLAALDNADDTVALVRLTRRSYARDTKVPPAFVSAAESHLAEIFDVWTRARPADDFAAVQPLLEKTLDLSREYTSFFQDYAEPIDALIEESDYGMTAETVGTLFAELRQALVPLVSDIVERPVIDDSCLYGHFPAAAQREFGEAVIKEFGYDFGRGRQDETHHPFMTKFSQGDIRITTHTREENLVDGIFSTFHEAGHALYEQGIDPRYEGTLLAEGTSNGVHESQSRLWENLIGRSYDFWTHYYPKLQASFPEQLRPVPLETFYRAINKVQPSLIRTAADEVTYNLHVMLRFDLERALLNGNLAVRDLPEAWHERMRSDLGVTPPDNKDGVMQDVHWFIGFIGGAFQGYTLGNIMSGQIVEAAKQAIPQLNEQIRVGDFAPVHTWLREQIYQYGSKFTAAEIIERATGAPLSIGPYMTYLRTKYSAIYNL
ncbi:carboxypeptidase M32 [bacterium]|nr:carboxypeptidase M32 [bacterium]